MKTINSLLFAAVSVLCIGVGAAIAQQSEVNASGADNLYWSQAGSSDVDAARARAHVLPVNRGYGTVANPR
jgi:hypothetical protein